MFPPMNSFLIKNGESDGVSSDDDDDDGASGGVLSDDHDDGDDDDDDHGDDDDDDGASGGVLSATRAKIGKNTSWPEESSVLCSAFTHIFAHNLYLYF